ncbi:MAG TPA: hypothetical protein GXZ62_01185, partial [Lentisphaerae bacterium]|nr:hypothetical protein [Lentisphaerota bacterium]
RNGCGAAAAAGAAGAAATAGAAGFKRTVIGRGALAAAPAGVTAA